MMVVNREVDALVKGAHMILGGKMSPETPQKLKTGSQNMANTATPNQLTVPEVTNLAEYPLEWKDDNQPTKKTTNHDKDILYSKEIKSEKQTKSPNSVEGDFSQNNSNLGQNSPLNSKDDQSSDLKYMKENERDSIGSPLQNKKKMPIKGHLLPSPTISIIPPQDEERNHSLDKEEEKEVEENRYKQKNAGQRKDFENHSHENFIEEEKPQIGESSVTFSEKDSNENSVTDDQRRALQELERQQKEILNSLLLPLEKNIKSRIHQLNQQLASEEPQKSERTTKVAFRDDLVQVISPTEDSQVKTHKDLKETKKIEDLGEALEPQKDVSDSSLETIFDMVVERDGHFDLVTPDDMTAFAGNKEEQLSLEKTNLLGSGCRPTSAINNRNIFPTFRIPKSRPISCPVYHSPYGLTLKQKELACKKMALEEKAKKEEEEAKRIREKEKKMLNEQAFQCWLRRIRENEQSIRKKEEHVKEMQKKEKEEKENEQKRLNKEVFHKWMQNKHEQQKNEEQLKYHKDEQYTSFFQPKTQEEIDRAYKRWLRKKIQETRQQKSLAKQKYRLQQRLLRRSRLIRNMTWDVCLNNSFHFTDHYG